MSAFPSSPTPLPTPSPPPTQWRPPLLLPPPPPPPPPLEEPKPEPELPPLPPPPPIWEREYPTEERGFIGETAAAAGRTILEGLEGIVKLGKMVREGPKAAYEQGRVLPYGPQPSRDSVANTIGGFLGSLVSPLAYIPDVIERSKGDPAASWGSAVLGVGLGLLPPAAILGKVPGLKSLVAEVGPKRFSKALTTFVAEGMVVGAVNATVEAGSELLVREAGGEAREINPLESFLVGQLGHAVLAGPFRAAGALARRSTQRRAEEYFVREKVLTREEVDLTRKERGSIASLNLAYARLNDFDAHLDRKPDGTLYVRGKKDIVTFAEKRALAHNEELIGVYRESLRDGAPRLVLEDPNIPPDPKELSSTIEKVASTKAKLASTLTADDFSKHGGFTRPLTDRALYVRDLEYIESKLQSTPTRRTLEHANALLREQSKLGESKAKIPTSMSVVSLFADRIISPVNLRPVQRLVGLLTRARDKGYLKRATELAHKPSIQSKITKIQRDSLRELQVLRKNARLSAVEKDALTRFLDAKYVARIDALLEKDLDSPDGARRLVSRVALKKEIVPPHEQPQVLEALDKAIDTVARRAVHETQLGTIIQAINDLREAKASPTAIRVLEVSRDLLLKGGDKGNPRSVRVLKARDQLKYDMENLAGYGLEKARDSITKAAKELPGDLAKDILVRASEAKSLSELTTLGEQVAELQDRYLRRVMKGTIRDLLKKAERSPQRDALYRIATGKEYDTRPLTTVERTRVKSEIAKAFGKKATKILPVADAFARTWAAATGRTPDDYYRGLRVVKGGEPGKGALYSWTHKYPQLFEKPLVWKSAFYSKAIRTVQERIKGPMTGKQALATLIGAGVRKEELKRSQLEKFFKAEGESRMFTPKEILDFLEATTPKFSEVIYTLDITNVNFQEDVAQPVAYEIGAKVREARQKVVELKDILEDLEYQERGISKEEYKRRTEKLEHKIELQSRYSTGLHTRLETVVHSTYTLLVYHGAWTAPGHSGYREIVVSMRAPIEKKYLIPRETPLRHYPQYDYLMHLRLTDRVDELTNSKILFLDELQSDLYLMGRRFGFLDPPTLPADYEIQEVSSGTWRITSKEDKRFLEVKASSREEAIYNALLEHHSGYGTIPPMPFIPDSYIELGLKRALRYAIDRGYKTLAWSSGRLQRLVTGGEKVEKLYDEIIPTVMRSLVKKYGVELKKYRIHAPGMWSKPGRPDTTPIPEPDQHFDVVGIELNQALIDGVLKGQPLYYTDAGAPQASYEISAIGERTIRALTDPNAAALPHELWHDFLEHLPAIDTALSEQAAKALGAENFASLTTEHKERWARAGEAYLREGVAPSSTLKKVFDTFKRWLIEIYRSIVGTPLENKLSPELKRIFDDILTRGDADSHLPSHGLVDVVKTDPRTGYRVIDFRLLDRRLDGLSVEELSNLQSKLKRVYRDGQIEKGLYKSLLKFTKTEDVGKAVEELTKHRQRTALEERLDKPIHLGSLFYDPGTTESKLYGYSRGKEDGFLLKILNKDLIPGMNRHYQNVADTRRFVAELSKEILGIDGTTVRGQYRLARYLGQTMPSGVSRGIAMKVFALSLDPGRAPRLYKEGVVVGGKLYDPQDIIKDLNDKDTLFVSKVKSFYVQSPFGEKAFENVLVLTGHEPRHVGEGYEPSSVRPERTRVDADFASIAGQFIREIDPLIERAVHGKQPFEVDEDFLSHFLSVNERLSLFAEIGRPLYRAQALITSKQFREAFISRYGESEYQSLQLYLADVFGRVGHDPTALDRAVDQFISSYAVSRVALNVTSAMKQFLHFFTLAGDGTLSLSSILRAFAEGSMLSKEVGKRMQRDSGLAYLRYTGGQYLHSFLIMTEQTRLPGRLGLARYYGMVLQREADRAMMKLVWRASELTSQKLGLKGLLARDNTASLFSLAAGRDQPTDNPLFSSELEIQAKRQPILRGALLFSRETNRIYSMIRRHLVKARYDPSPANIGAAARALFFGGLAGAVAATGVDMLRRLVMGRTVEPTDVAAAGTRNLLGYWYLLAPVETLVQGFIDEKHRIFDRSGGPFVEATRDIWKLGWGLWDAARAGDEYYESGPRRGESKAEAAAYRALDGTLALVSGTMGLPFWSLWQQAKGLYRWSDSTYGLMVELEAETARLRKDGLEHSARFMEIERARDRINHIHRQRESGLLDRDLASLEIRRVLEMLMR